VSKPTLLLHTCCGICGAWIPEKLSCDFNVTIFYYNPNIHPVEEYEKRREAVHQMSEVLKIPMIEDEYNPRVWFEKVRGQALEHEGGARCLVCFEMRLRRTAEEAKRLGFDYFASTLTVGRFKPAAIINPIGERIATEVGIKFLAGDFKKQGGEAESQKRGKACGIYHQNYCGCIYSKIGSGR
jgi:predicted adenine nucleotide alpha hydrolase (AANH) superfamily ATPase